MYEKRAAVTGPESLARLSAGLAPSLLSIMLLSWAHLVLLFFFFFFFFNFFFLSFLCFNLDTQRYMRVSEHGFAVLYLLSFVGYIRET